MIHLTALRPGNYSGKAVCHPRAARCLVRARRAAMVVCMLVSKAAIREELGSRLAEFAPPGEHLQMQDRQGRLHRIRFRIAQKWRAEAIALTAAMARDLG